MDDVAGDCIAAMRERRGRGTRLREIALRFADAVVNGPEEGDSVQKRASRR
jgi:hypothetical protein